MNRCEILILIDPGKEIDRLDEINIRTLLKAMALGHGGGSRRQVTLVLNKRK